MHSPRPETHGWLHKGSSHKCPVKPSLQMHPFGVCRVEFVGSTQLPPLELHPANGTHWSHLLPCHPGWHLHWPGATQLPLIQLVQIGMSQNPPCHFVGSVHAHASPVPLQLPCTHPGKSMQTLQFTLSHPTSQAQMSGPSQMPCSQPLLHTGVAHGIRGSVSPTFDHPFWHVMLPFESQVYLV